MIHPIPHFMERIDRCADCLTPSTADVFGTAAFVLLERGGGFVEVCEDCHTIEVGGLGAVIPVLRHRMEKRIMSDRNKLVWLELGTPERENYLVGLLEKADLTDDPEELGRLQAKASELRPQGTDSNAAIHTISVSRKEAIKEKRS